MQWIFPTAPSPIVPFDSSIQAIIRVPAPALPPSGSWKYDLAPLIAGRLGCSLPASLVWPKTEQLGEDRTLLTHTGVEGVTHSTKSPPGALLSIF